MSEVCSLFVWEDNQSVGQSACLMSKWVPSKFTLEAAMSIATTDLILCAGPLDWLCLPFMVETFVMHPRNRPKFSIPTF
jgi:hypothetical protein